MSERRSSTGLKLLAAACVAAGVAGLVLRFAWLPPDAGTLLAMGTWVVPLLLLGAGAQAWRESGPGAPSVGATLAGVCAGILVATGAMFMVKAQPLVLADVELAEVEASGLVVPMPRGWPVEREVLAFHGGVRRLVPPGDPGRAGYFVDLRWNVGEAMTASQLEEYLRGQVAGARLEIVDRRPLRSGALGGHVFELRVDGAPGWSAFWFCPPRVVNLVVFLPGTAAQSGVLLERMLEGARCGDPGEAGQVAFPVFPAPDGYERRQGAAEIVYAGPDGDTYFVAAGIPGTSVSQVVASPDERRRLLETVVGMRDVILIRVPKKVGAKGSGAPSQVWLAHGTGEDGSKQRALVTGWHCRDSDVGFLIVHTGPFDEPPEPHLAQLAKARCPAP